MRSASNRAQPQRSRRVRRLLMSSRRFVLFAILSAFIAVNSLLYWGINRAEGRSMDPRSLDVREKVISIDSWQQTEEEFGGDTRWDLYIDSPRHFRGLSSKQRGKGESKGEVKRSAAPRVVYITRSTDSNPSNEKERTQHRGSDNLVKNAAVNDKLVTDRSNYQPIENTKQKGLSSRNSGINMAIRKHEDKMIAVRKMNEIVNDNTKLYLNQSKLYRAPVKLKNRQSKAFPQNPRRVNEKGSRRGAVQSPVAPDNLEIGGIRFYNRPPWLSKNDADVLRRLVDDPIASFQTFHSKLTGKLGLGVLIYEPDYRTAGFNNQRTTVTELCADKGVTCAMLFPPAEIHRVLAFHLDRVLGFNRTLPTVSRKLSGEIRRQAGMPVDINFPLMLYEPSLYEDTELSEITRDQLSDCLAEGNGGKYELDACSGILTDDWGAVAVFDFLLQIYHRLDFGCCGLDGAERHRRCGMSVVSGGARCNSLTGGQQKLGCNFRVSSETDKLVLVENLVDLQAPVDKLDFMLLQGPNSFPARAVAMIKEGRLRQMLLQSIAADKSYWESQGGRSAIEDILDVLDRRGRIFLRHISS